MADIASSALMQARQGEAALNHTTLARSASKEDIELAEHLISHSRAPQNSGERTHEGHQHMYASREIEVGIDGSFDQAQSHSPRSATAEREPFGPQPHVLSVGQQCKYVTLTFR